MGSLDPENDAIGPRVIESKVLRIETGLIAVAPLVMILFPRELLGRLESGGFLIGEIGCFWDILGFWVCKEENGFVIDFVHILKSKRYRWLLYL